MLNYYEEPMPNIINKDEYQQYYFEETLEDFDKINIIIKKGKPFQRQALIKNLIIYIKEPLFESLINFIISDIPTWDSETILHFPKSLYLLLINKEYILENELFNMIFKHIINFVSSGPEIYRDEYIYYFNKIIEYYSIIDINNNNKIKKNIFPYKINDDIIEYIINLGKFGETSINKRLSCYLSSSLCRIMIKINEEENINNLNDENIQKLYKRLSYLFYDGDKIVETQMVRELIYIIPLFKDIMFTNEDINQAIESYINLDTNHIIQVMAIISLLKNIIYLKNQEKNVNNILLKKIKEITKDIDYESIYKNFIYHILITEIYNNYESLNLSFIYQVFNLHIIQYYYIFFELEPIHIKNFDKFNFLINFFLENEKYFDNIKINNNNNNKCYKYKDYTYKELVDEINLETIMEEYFIKIYDKLFLCKDNNNNEKKKNELNKKNNEESKNNEILLISDNNNIDNLSKLIYDKFSLEDMIDNKINNIYSKEDLKKIFYVYLPKIIQCLPNINTNKNLCNKLNFLFSKDNILFILNIYSFLMNNNNNINNFNLNEDERKIKKKLKNNPFYELFLFLLKKNNKLFILSNKIILNKNNKEIIYEGNIYNKLINSILFNINLIYLESPNLITNDIHLFLANIIKILIPKFYKYYKNITYNEIANNNDSLYVNCFNSCFNDNKEILKLSFHEKIFERIFNDLISKVINRNNLGHYIIKEYVEIIPYLILYSYYREKYYDFFKKEILFSDNFYKRKYSINFFDKCFKLFSFEYFYNNNLFNDIILLMKDKVNLISNNIIELVYKYNKKIINFSKKIFKEICDILKEIYNLNNLNKNNAKFDNEKNIIINKIISINNNINKFYTEDDMNNIKLNEDKLLTKESEILKHEKSINNKNKKRRGSYCKNYYLNINNINIKNNNNNNTNLNNFKISSSTFHTPKDKINSLISNKQYIKSNTNKKQLKMIPFFEKSPNEYSNNKRRKSFTNKNFIFENNLIKENKTKNESVNIKRNNKYHLSSRNIIKNKYYLPELKGLKVNKNDLSYINNNNIRSIDNMNSNLKMNENEEKEILEKKEYNNNNEIINEKNNGIKKDLRINSFTKNRIQSPKIKVMNSFTIIVNDNPKNNNEIKENEKKIFISNNKSNLKYNYYFNNKERKTKSLSNKQIMTSLGSLGNSSKNVRLKIENTAIGSGINNHKIYIDANKAKKE